jgi:hypothetical protein
VYHLPHMNSTQGGRWINKQHYYDHQFYLMNKRWYARQARQA